MNAKGDLFLLFTLMLGFILVVFYVGSTSDVLALSKAIQQLVYLLSGRNSTGGWGVAPSAVPGSAGGGGGGSSSAGGGSNSGSTPETIPGIPNWTTAFSNMTQSLATLTQTLTQLTAKS